MIASIRKYIVQHCENALHFTIWLSVFAVPVVSMHLRITDTCEPFDWGYVMSMWKVMSLFLISFLIHKIFLLPKIIYQKRRKEYVFFTFLLIILFGLSEYVFYPFFVHTDSVESLSEALVDANLNNSVNTPSGHIALQILIVHIMIVVLMFGMNFGITMFFKSNEDLEKYRELQNKNLEQQMVFLKYQINPHFFMNTLNNIHALIDIAPDKAKNAIIVLSKMMRYVLYEGNHKLIPLQKESEFISSFIELMRMRYTEKVKVRFDIPERFITGEIPPLLLICFIENAFKHGVTYQQESTIDVSLKMKERKICFTCYNKKPKKTAAEKGGLGLPSAKQRLNLIYPHNHKLEIIDKDDSFSVFLELPLTDKLN